MTTLVTGATGLLGNNIVRALLDRGERVRVMVRQTSPTKPLEGLDVETCEGDIRNAADVERAAADTEFVIHSAAYLQIGRTGLDLSRKINVNGSRNVAVAARQAGARMIHVSTVDTLGVGKPDALADEEQQFGEKIPSSYSISKTEAERAVEQEIEAGLDAAIVHPGFIVGPWDWKPSSGRMLLAVARQFTPVAPSGGHTVADACDVSTAILAAREKATSGEHYILGGHPISYFDYWKLCAEVSGGRPPQFRMGPVIRNLAGKAGDLWTALSGNEGDVNSASLGISGQWHFYSSQKAADALGYQCRPIRESVESSWRWLQEYGYAK